MSWFNQFSIRSRLISAFGLIWALLAAVVGMGWYNGMQTQLGVERIVQSEMVKLDIVSRIDSLTKSNARNTLELFVVETSKRPEIRARMGKTRTELDSLFQQLQPMLIHPKGQAAFEEMRSKRAEYVRAFTQAADLLETDTERARILLGTQVLPAVDALAEPIDRLKDLQQELADGVGDKLISTTKTANYIGIGIGAVAGLIIISVAGMLITSIMKPLRHAMDVASSVGKGDLTMHIEAEGNNELTRLLESMQTMQSHLSGVLTRIQQSTAQVASASSQIAAANLDLSSRTEAQASALEETAASMEEMTASVQQNEQITRSAKDMSQRAAAEAQDVGRLVQEVVAMIQDLHGSSQRMNDIIGVIDGIAFQTNILALNAAVEAARAGEQGRGFAVVAAEVRALAQRSAQAAREIKGILQTNVEKMSQGSELAEKAGGAVVSVVTAIDRVNTTVAEVAMATKEQSEGIDQIGQSVVQLDQATQQNAALVEETSAATSNLDDQVQTLQQQIQGFQIDQRRASAEMVPALPSQSSSRAGVKRLA